jgi:hypothetical protein
MVQRERPANRQSRGLDGDQRVGSRRRIRILPLEAFAFWWDECLLAASSSEILTTMNRFIFLLATRWPLRALAAAPTKPAELSEGNL